MPEHDFGHFRLLKRHAGGSDRLARCDFLLVLYTDLRARWNRCGVINIHIIGHIGTPIV